jgi:hypothetical protein
MQTARFQGGEEEDEGGGERGLRSCSVERFRGALADFSSSLADFSSSSFVAEE